MTRGMLRCGLRLDCRPNSRLATPQKLTAIHRLLKERPVALGLAVPGMPLGSPGMDREAFDHKTEPYNVLLVLRDGATRVFQAY